MNTQFMLTDLVRTAEAELYFSVVLLMPGYVLAWFFDLMAFRRRNLLTRLTLAVPLSIGICPIVSYLLWRFVSPAVWIFYITCAGVFLVLLYRERHALLSRTALRTLFQRDCVFLAIIAGWVVLGTLALIDLQIGHRLYFPTVSYDYSLRTTVTSSIARMGVPAQNPFFFPGRTFGMHYHYFWLIICAITERISIPEVSARHAVIAGSIWCAIGMMAVIALYLRFFQRRGGADIRRRTLYGVGLLAVTGLDILPVIVIEIASNGYFADLEWWNEQVSAWITTALWVPHNLAALIACLTGFLLIWDASRLADNRSRIVSAITAGLMFASAAGLAIYVTFVFAIFLFLWLVTEFLRKHRQHAGLICLAGLAAAVFAAPFLAELLLPVPGSGAASGSIATSGGFPLKFAVRSFRFFDSAMGLADSGWKTAFAHLLILPVNYVLELGFFLIAGVIQCRRMYANRSHLTDDQLCSLVMAATSLLICTFVSSGIVTSNDLGWRGFLPAQFVLLLWGADLLADGWLGGEETGSDASQTSERNKNKRMLIVATLLLGVSGSLYALIKVRFYPLLSDTTQTPLYGWLSPDRKLGARTYALRQIYDDLRGRIPTNAIFQHNPHIPMEDLFHGIYADRQVAAEGEGCGVEHGGDPQLCQERIGTINDLFENPQRFNAGQIDQVCSGLSIDVLVVKDKDPAWKDPESWVWKRKPLLANDFARVFTCGPKASSWKTIQ